MTGLALLLCFSALSLTPIAAEEEPRPLVLHIADLPVGIRSRDRDVIAKFGPGCFVSNEPHGGGRYFTNPERTLTLHVGIGVDMVTESIELRAGLKVPAGCREPVAAGLVVAGLSKPPPVEHGIRLGMGKRELVAILGQPDEAKLAQDSETLSYEAYFEEDPRVTLFYNAWYEFSQGVLVAVGIRDGE